jgi:hypothetical protein
MSSVRKQQIPIVLSLAIPDRWLEPTIYHTQGGNADHYTTDAEITWHPKSERPSWIIVSHDDIPVERVFLQLKVDICVIKYGIMFNRSKDIILMFYFRPRTDLFIMWGGPVIDVDWWQLISTCINII